MGLGGSLVALIAAAIALIVLPAVLALLGERVNALSPPFLRRRAEAEAKATTEGFWYRLSRLVMRVPGRIAIATTLLLIVLGIPFFGIKFTSVDAQVLPESASARQVDDVLRADFPPYRDLPDRDRRRRQERREAAWRSGPRSVDGVAEVAKPVELAARPLRDQRRLEVPAALGAQPGPRPRDPRPRSQGSR